MSDNLPQYVRDALAKKFTPAEVETIDANWYTYGDDRMSFSNSSAAKMVRAGRDVLACLEYEKQQH